jgi:hypothetical protein
VDSRNDRQRCGTLFQDVCRCEDSQRESQGEQLIHIPNTRQHRSVSYAFEVPQDSKAVWAYEEEVEDLDPSYGRSSSDRPEDEKRHDQETKDRGDKLGCKWGSGGKGLVARPACNICLKGPTDIAQTTFLAQATDIASKTHARPCPIDGPCGYEIFHARLRRDWTQRSSVSYSGHVPKRKQRRKCWRRCDFEQASEKEVAVR